MSGAPPAWSVPCEWSAHQRCLIICGGESVFAQMDAIRRFQGRVIAIKEGVLLRPTADVMFISGEHACSDTSRELITSFLGTHVINRGRFEPSFPSRVKRVGRSKDHQSLCVTPTMVAGWDGGTSAINLAFHFGARDVLLVGYDMTGGRWFNRIERLKRFHKPAPSKDAHAIHLSTLAAFAKDCAAKGMRVVNCSPISKATCFPYQPLESSL